MDGTHEEPELPGAEELPLEPWQPEVAEHLPIDKEGPELAEKLSNGYRVLAGILQANNASYESLLTYAQMAMNTLHRSYVDLAGGKRITGYEAYRRTTGNGHGK